MGNWQAPPAALDEVLEIRRRLTESLFRIKNFLRETEHGLEKAEGTWSGIQQKFEAAAGGAKLFLEDGEQLEATADEFRAFRDLANEALNGFEHYPSMLAEMSLVSVFASFDAFLTDLLATVFRARPEMLRSGRHLTAESVLEATSLDDLVDELIAKEVYEWRLSFREQMSRLEQRFGICLDSHSAETEILSEAHERRHLFVHLGGVVDDHYLAAVPSAEVERGFQMAVNADYVGGVINAMDSVGLAIGTELPAKCLRIDPSEFSVERQRTASTEKMDVD
jgi:hypothetical protein